MTAPAVRLATPDDRLAVHRIVDGAILAVPALDARIEAGDVLLAVRADNSGDGESDDDGPGRPLGTLVRKPIDGGYEILAVAVRPSHRGRGIGRALVEAAAEREGRIVAEFDAAVRPFYESLGFAIRPVDGGDGDDGSEGGGEKRYRGVLKG